MEYNAYVVYLCNGLKQVGCNKGVAYIHIYCKKWNGFKSKEVINAN